MTTKTLNTKTNHRYFKLCLLLLLVVLEDSFKIFGGATAASKLSPSFESGVHSKNYDIVTSFANYGSFKGPANSNLAPAEPAEEHLIHNPQTLLVGGKGATAKEWWLLKNDGSNPFKNDVTNNKISKRKVKTFNKIVRGKDVHNLLLPLISNKEDQAVHEHSLFDHKHNLDVTDKFQNKASVLQDPVNNNDDIKLLATFETSEPDTNIGSPSSTITYYESNALNDISSLLQRLLLSGAVSPTPSIFPVLKAVPTKKTIQNPDLTTTTTYKNLIYSLKPLIKPNAKRRGQSQDTNLDVVHNNFQSLPQNNEEEENGGPGNSGSPVTNPDIGLSFIDLESGIIACQFNETSPLKVHNITIICDGKMDCLDGADETNEHCRATCEPECERGKGVCLLGTVNLPGKCYCVEGYSGETCSQEDENECIVNPCGSYALCTNTVGSFKCECIPGFTGDGFSCEDIDECKLGTDNCNEEEVCFNLQGTYKCGDCPSGTRKIGKLCKDIDECSEGSHDCHIDAQCTNLEQGFKCTCNPGFTGNGRKCSDVDECNLDGDDFMAIHLCSPNSMCINTPGSYNCSCLQGFVGNGFNCTPATRIQTSENLAVDKQQGTEMDSTSLEHSISGPGTFNNPNITVVLQQNSVDKPSSLNNPVDSATDCHDFCDANADCIRPVQGDDGVLPYCKCKIGFQGNGFTCSDIDECSFNETNFCGPNKVCVNAIGSYVCICDTGYQLVGGNCININECMDANNPCPTSSMCIDKDGSYECICDSGYQFLYNKCEDVNECISSEGLSCPVNSMCKNLNGSYDCECKVGYVHITKVQTAIPERSGTPLFNFDCQDIDECLNPLVNPCGTDPNTDCVNIEGSYECPCKLGFKRIDGGNNGTDNIQFQLEKAPLCQDVNECQLGFKELVSLVIGSPENSFPPAVMETIHSVGIDKLPKHRDRGILGDEQENFNFTIPSHSILCADADNLECVNTYGSYRCQCKPGYRQFGRPILPSTNQQANFSPLLFCTDIDECHTDVDPCQNDPNSKCVNLPGTFDCTCLQGFNRDNSTQKCLPKVSLLGESPMVCSAQAIADCQSILGRASVCRTTNNGGTKHECGCASGFYVSSHSQSNGRQINRTCVDIDECRLSIFESDLTRNDPADDGDEQPFGDSFTQSIMSSTIFQRILSASELAESHKRKLVVAAVAAAQLDIEDSSISSIKNDSLSIISKLLEMVKEAFEEELISERDEEKQICSFLIKDALCSNTNGSFDCSCPIGYELDLIKLACTDIDECNSFSSNNNNTTCKDIPNSVCINVPGNYKCDCESGYAWDAGIGACQDIDECATNIRNPCKWINETDITTIGQQTIIDSVCHNVLGGYECSCPQGFQKLYRLIEGKATIINDVNTIRKGDLLEFKCQDIDECNIDRLLHLSLNENTEELIVPCLNISNTLCVNKLGSYECDCLPGYVAKAGNNITSSCQDINECASNLTNECSLKVPGSLCVNRPGTYDCPCPVNTIFIPKSSAEIAKKGERFNASIGPITGGMCITKIAITQPTSIRTSFSFTDATKENSTQISISSLSPSSCLPGYEAKETSINNTKVCVDIDECQTEENACDTTRSACINLPGSYKCQCNSGFTHDITATSEDFTQISVIPLPFVIAKKASNLTTVATASIHRSNNKFEKIKTNRIIKRRQAPTDTNSISSPVLLDTASTVGTNVQQQRQAQIICYDIDECRIFNNKTSNEQRKIKLQEDSPLYPFHKTSSWSAAVTFTDDSTTRVCHPSRASCINTIGSHTCRCKPGFIGDGVNCEDIDECSTFPNKGKPICPINSYCLNTQGSYSCECLPGYMLNPNYYTSQTRGHQALQNYGAGKRYKASTHDTDPEDIDIEGNEIFVTEPDDDKVVVKRKQKNSRKRKSRELQKNFSSTPIIILEEMCLNINECLNSNVHVCDPETTICNDRDGSYECLCKPGYEVEPSLNGTTFLTTTPSFLETFSPSFTNDSTTSTSDGRGIIENPRDEESIRVSCVDIDECSVNHKLNRNISIRNDCHSTAICRNLNGSFECLCPNGTKGNGKSGCFTPTEQIQLTTTTFEIITMSPTPEISNRILKASDQKLLIAKGKARLIGIDNSLPVTPNKSTKVLRKSIGKLASSLINSKATIAGVKRLTILTNSSLSSSLMETAARTSKIVPPNLSDKNVNLQENIKGVVKDHRQNTVKSSATIDKPPNNLGIVIKKTKEVQQLKSNLKVPIILKPPNKSIQLSTNRISKIQENPVKSIEKTLIRATNKGNKGAIISSEPLNKKDKENYSKTLDPKKSVPVILSTQTTQDLKQSTKIVKSDVKNKKDSVPVRPLAQKKPPLLAKTLKAQGKASLPSLLLSNSTEIASKQIVSKADSIKVNDTKKKKKIFGPISYLDPSVYPTHKKEKPTGPVSNAIKKAGGKLISGTSEARTLTTYITPTEKVISTVTKPTAAVEKKLLGISSSSSSKASFPPLTPKVSTTIIDRLSSSTISNIKKAPVSNVITKDQKIKMAADKKLKPRTNTETRLANISINTAKAASTSTTMLPFIMVRKDEELSTPDINKLAQKKLNLVVEDGKNLVKKPEVVVKTTRKIVPNHTTNDLSSKKLLKKLVADGTSKEASPIKKLPTLASAVSKNVINAQSLTKNRDDNKIVIKEIKDAKLLSSAKVIKPNDNNSNTKIGQNLKKVVIKETGAITKKLKASNREGVIVMEQSILPKTGSRKTVTKTIVPKAPPVRVAIIGKDTDRDRLISQKNGNQSIDKKVVPGKKPVVTITPKSENKTETNKPSKQVAIKAIDKLSEKKELYIAFNKSSNVSTLKIDPQMNENSTKVLAKKSLNLIRKVAVASALLTKKQTAVQRTTQKVEKKLTGKPRPASVAPIVIVRKVEVSRQRANPIHTINRRSNVTINKPKTTLTTLTTTTGITSSTDASLATNKYFSYYYEVSTTANPNKAITTGDVVKSSNKNLRNSLQQQKDDSLTTFILPQTITHRIISTASTGKASSITSTPEILDEVLEMKNTEQTLPPTLKVFQTSFTGNNAISLDASPLDRDYKVLCYWDKAELILTVPPLYRAVIYGKAKLNECQRELRNEGTANFKKISLEFGYDECGAALNLDGNSIEYSLGIILTITPPLITKNSQSFTIMCSYPIAELKAVSDVNISNFKAPQQSSGSAKSQRLEEDDTIQLRNTPAPLNCFMQIVDPSKRLINEANVGDVLMLLIKCSDDSYGVVGYDCWAANVLAESQRVQMINENGCSTDLALMQNFRKENQSNAIFSLFRAFKFPFESNIRFECRIKPCIGQCEPLKCPSNVATSSNNNAYKNEGQYDYTYGKRRRKRSVQYDNILTGRNNGMENKAALPSIAYNLDTNINKNFDDSAASQTKLVSSVLSIHSKSMPNTNSLYIEQEAKVQPDNSYFMLLGKGPGIDKLVKPKANHINGHQQDHQSNKSRKFLMKWLDRGDDRYSKNKFLPLFQHDKIPITLFSSRLTTIPPLTDLKNNFNSKIQQKHTYENEFNIKEGRLKADVNTYNDWRNDLNNNNLIKSTKMVTSDETGKFSVRGRTVENSNYLANKIICLYPKSLYIGIACALLALTLILISGHVYAFVHQNRLSKFKKRAELLPDINRWPITVAANNTKEGSTKDDYKIMDSFSFSSDKSFKIKPLHQEYTTTTCGRYNPTKESPIAKPKSTVYMEEFDFVNYGYD